MATSPPSLSEILSQKFWIFDLDGTLTVPVHDFKEIRITLGIPLEDDILGFISKQPNSKKTKLLNQLDEIEKSLAWKSEPGPGVEELIGILDTRKVQKAIITRNTKENALISLEKIGIASSFAPKFIFGRNEAPPKPDPTAIHMICEGWGIKTNQAVMVGDYLFDIETGNAAGTATIHIDHHQQKNWKSLTDLQVDSITELNELFKTNLSCS